MVRASSRALELCLCLWVQCGDHLASPFLCRVGTTVEELGVSCDYWKVLNFHKSEKTTIRVHFRIISIPPVRIHLRLMFLSPSHQSSVQNCFLSSIQSECTGGPCFLSSLHDPKLNDEDLNEASSSTDCVMSLLCICM